MATSKIIPNAQVVHSKYAGSPVLQVSGGVYYGLFENLPAGLWLITITAYFAAGEMLVCYGNSIDNIISENNDGGHSGAGVIHLTSTTTIQMYFTNNNTVNRFKAEAIRLA